MQDYTIELLQIVEAATPQLLALGDDASARRRAPGTWSPREIVGHLIDSASNNHQRFVRALWQDDLMFTGYAQAEWVEAQQYQQAPWPDLVTLWSHFNRHLARVMTAVPADIRTRLHHRHNLHQLAWQPVAEGEPATLDYFMRDYVRHLEHHLRQIFGPRWSA
jgi:DinB family protein